MVFGLVSMREREEIIQASAVNRYTDLISNLKTNPIEKK